jgi:hypothetical protein
MRSPLAVKSAGISNALPATTHIKSLFLKFPSQTVTMLSVGYDINVTEGAVMSYKLDALVSVICN